MAVPPADDGSLADVDASPRSTYTLLTIGLMVVALVCVVVLAVRFATADGSPRQRFDQVLGNAPAKAEANDDAAERESVMSQANQFMLRVNTYGPDKLAEDLTMPDYVASVHEVITPKFAAGFDQNVTLAEQSVAKAGYARSAELFSTGVDTMDADSASVLVSGVINSTYPDAKKSGRTEFPPEPFRVRVSLVLVEGTWLVDDFEPVTDDVEQVPSGGEPTEPTGPTEPAATDPAGSPTGKPTGAPSKGAKP